MSTRSAHWLVSLTLLAACYQDPPEQAIESTSTAGETGAAPPEVAIALDGDGIQLVIVQSGSTRPIPFGTPRDTLVAILARATDTPPADTGTSADCGLGYATWTDGLTTTFRNASFVGWSVRDSGLTTMSGIGVGSTHGAVDSVYAMESFESSLGSEFTAGGLAGVFGAGDRVVALWAGEVCLAR